MIERWENEERLVESTCLDLEDASLSASHRPETDDTLFVGFQSAMREDVLVQFKTVVDGLGAKCDADKVLLADGQAIASCETSVTNAFKSAEEGVDVSKKKLAHALKAAEINGQTLTHFPVRALRKLDLSAAVVRGLVTVGDETAQIIDDLAASAGNFKGVARALASRVAAELVAHALDAALDAMEKKSLATRPAVSRRACHLYRQSLSRPLVTTTLLRRTILRSATTDLSRSGKNAYAGMSACDELDALEGGACKKMARLADSERDETFSSLDLPPTVATKSAAGRLVRERTDQNAARLANPAFASTDAAAETLAKKYVEATRSCASPEDCTLEKLNLVVSITNTYEIHPTEEQWASVLGNMKDWEKFGVSVVEMQNDVREIRGAVGQVFTALREKEDANRTLMAAVMELLKANEKCREAVGATVAEREKVANKLLVNGTLKCAPTSANAPSAPDEYRRTFGSSTSPIVVTMRRSDVCNLAHPFEVEVAADAIFEPCSPTFVDQANRSAVEGTLRELGAAFAGSALAEVVVLGHADKNVVDPQSYTCKRYGITDNWGLSRRRAEQVKVALASSVGSLPLVSEPRGSSSPVCTEDTESCDARNRRVSFVLRAPRLTLNIASCTQR